ncbi:MAG: tetratricopeptide repeat protein [Chitinophagaceae bacterium]
MKKFYLVLLLITEFANAQHSPYDSLEKKLAFEKKDENKLELLSQLQTVALNHDLEKALQYAKQGVDLADKISDKKWQPKFYEIAGKAHSYLLQIDTARIYLDKAIDAYKIIDDKKGQATSLFRISWIYKKKGNIEQALKLDLEGLKLMEATGDQSGISTAHNKVAEDLTRQGRFKEALEYANKSIEISKKTGIANDLLFAYFITGNVYIAMADNPQSLAYYDKAVSLVNQARLPMLDLASLTNSHGNALKHLERYPEALLDYEKALSICKRLNLPSGISAGLANLGEVNLRMGNYAKAIGYQLETVRLQERDGDYANLRENYKHVSEIYKQMGNYQLALDYNQKALHLGDSLFYAESDKTMAKMLTEYETSKKEATIASQQKELSQQKRIQWLGGGVVALLIGFLFFGYRSYRARTKTNKLLAAKNAENELLLKEIHHRVKNNLQVVSGLLSLQSAQTDDPATRSAMQESRNRVLSIGIVHQKLYQGTNLGSVEMKDYFLNLSESILDSFGADKRVTIECAMEKLDLDIDTAVPLGLIVNELLTNTLKYAFPKDVAGNVLIRLEKKNNGALHLEVSDNGVGKSGVTQGTGFGGQLVSMLSRQLGGTMREEIKNGTRIFFEFKMDNVA